MSGNKKRKNKMPNNQPHPRTTGNAAVPNITGVANPGPVQVTTGHDVNQANQNDAAPGAVSLDFMWKVHGYTNEYIRFADPKAAILIALASGLIAALYSAKCHQLCAPNRLDWRGATLWDTSLGFTSLMSFSLLGASVLAAAWAVGPRLWRTLVRNLRDLLGHWLDEAPPAPLGVIFWNDVLRYPTADQYWAAVSAMTTVQQAEAVARHVYVLAGIAKAKFTWITWGMRCGYLGAVFACITLLLTRL